MYQLVVDELYPEGATYNGPAEGCVAEFKGPPEQLLPVTWASWMAAEFAEHIVLYGGHMLQVKVWADWSPTWYTLYKIEATAHASPLPWAAIGYALGAIFGGMGLVMATWSIYSKFWGAAPPPPPPPPYECPYCTATFNSLAALNAHIAQEHPEEEVPGPQPSPDPTPFQCAYCKKYFYSQSDLDEHIALEHAGIWAWVKKNWYVPVGGSIVAVALLWPSGRRK